MGKLLFILRYVFLLFSSDKDESRKHIHVQHDERLCKFWLEPDIELAYNQGFADKELNQIRNLIVEHKDIIESQVDLFHTGQKVTAVRI